MAKTQPEPVRDQDGDLLLTAANCVLALIDFQPEQYYTVTSATREEIDRTGVNAWEDPDSRAAIEGTGRRKVVIAGLWTEVCLTFPALDMLAAGYDVYPVADAVGGISTVAHERAFDRMIAAGAHPVTAISFGSELMRNWARADSDNLRKVMR